MRLLTVQTEHGLGLAARAGGDVIDLARVHSLTGAVGRAPSPGSFIEDPTGESDRIRALLERAADAPDAILDLTRLELGPCVASPSKIVCVGLNYRRHAEESGMAIPDQPLLFMKPPNSLTGSGRPVQLPPFAVEYDYEVELAVVIGARATSVRAERALDHVLGYASANDLSARDLQFATSQWLLGKGLDGFLPIGPDLVTADEVPDPGDLSLRTWLDGDLRQSSTTRDMIFTVPEIIEYISRYMTLEPGDIILTGTPEGVILGHPGVAWLKPGDSVVVEVGSLGQLHTTFVGGDQPRT